MRSTRVSTAVQNTRLTCKNPSSTRQRELGPRESREKKNTDLWPTTTFTGDCEACTGSCQKEEALTTDETSEQGVSLVLGHYVGGTFVAA